MCCVAKSRALCGDFEGKPFRWDDLVRDRSLHCASEKRMHRIKKTVFENIILDKEKKYKQKNAIIRLKLINLKC